MNNQTISMLLCCLCFSGPFLLGCFFSAWFLPRKKNYGFVGALLPAFLRQRLDSFKAAMDKEE